MGGDGAGRGREAGQSVAVIGRQINGNECMGLSKNPPPLYYRGPNFQSLSAPGTGKPELKTKTFAT